MHIGKEVVDYKLFKNHVAKLYIPLLELALSDNFPKEEVNYIRTLAPTLDKVKQRGLYVDYLTEQKKWVTPQDDDLKDIARTNLDYAKRIYQSTISYLI